MDIDVIGAGLAGAEAAWQLARRGHLVRLREMRPGHTTPAHQTGPGRRDGLLQFLQERRPEQRHGHPQGRAEDAWIPSSCAAPRPPGCRPAIPWRWTASAFADRVTADLRGHPGIHWVEDLVARPEPGRPTLVATGPLTAEPLAAVAGRGLRFRAPVLLRRHRAHRGAGLHRHLRGLPGRPLRQGRPPISATAPWTGRPTRPSWTPCWPRPGPSCTISTRPTSRPACPSRSWPTGAGRPCATGP